MTDLMKVLKDAESRYLEQGLDIWTANQVAFDDDLLDNSDDEYWLEIGEDWDVNIYRDEGELKATAYPVRDGNVDITKPLKII